ncbi:MAG TPA: multicopper oxidase domain-containing protein [Thermoanaerobaculia bacterium]|nr:multicopper oxidase domain-containing protein [Thermoanaerobaculia bacterium]
MFSRRKILFSSLAAAVGGTLFGREVRALPQQPPNDPVPKPLSPARRRRGRAPVVMPDGQSLPWRMENGVKVFHLVAEPVRREFTDGLVVNCFGYNGVTPGPTIEAFEGERVRIYVTNRLPEGTSVHWHGVILPNGMDGVSGLNQPKINPGETYAYEFTLQQTGTLMYHPHFDEMVQIAMGLHGFFIIHPRDQRVRRVDRDFAIFLNEWSIKPGTATPDPTVMLDFNTFTMNSRVFPGTTPMLVETGDRVRIRLANLSMNSHPIHIHGHKFYITGTDAGPIQESGWWPENSANVPVGTTRDVEFTADNPGDWAFHCHKTHHVMNQMGHDLPNLLGVDTGDVPARVSELVPGTMVMGETGMGAMSEHQMEAPRNSIPMRGGIGPFGPIDMGGMFTIIKIRDRIDGDRDPGWYRQPPGTSASRVASMSGPASSTPAPHEGHDVTTTHYTCPMHPEVSSDIPGTCPKCGMALVPRK